ncbi:MAG: chemotaxis protein CheB [Frateuria sp.]|nr:chemotaxis protein CheB [Frateuria sp.]
MNPASAPSHPLVVIGASFGGVEALITLVAGLPKDFPAFLAVVQHVGTQPSVLPELLTRAGPLRAVHPRHDEPLRLGRIYVAPPDHHLLMTPRTVRLSRGPRENHTRPAIDPLFRTAALHWGRKVTGVVLTGELDDGTAGLAAIKLCGGCTVVQDPQEAIAPSMPSSALANVEVDHCVLLPAIAPLLSRLVAPPTPVAPPEPPPESLLREQSVFEGVEPMDNLHAIGTPTQLTCPDCGGTLSEVQSGRPLRYRCHTGHAYTAKSLESAQAERTDHAMQASFRALKEREQLLRRMAGVSRSLGDDAQAEVGMQQAARVQEQAARLAELIAEGTGGA